jgi:3-dehydroquinate dehydratase-2
MATKPIYVLNGPSLNLLGIREPHIYGYETLADVQALCEAKAKAHGFDVVFRQSNHEGELVDWIQEARTKAAALVLNPAAYGHTSIAIHDALKALEVPVVECHLSNLAKREPFRHHSYVTSAARGIVAGFGAMSYELAVTAAARAALAAASPAAAKP